MPYEVAIPAIDTALRAVLVADAALSALLANRPVARGGGPAIYTDGEVPSGAPMPYLTIGAWTQVPFHSFSPSGSPGLDGFGWNCTGQVKAVGQISTGRNEMTLHAIMSAVFAAVPDGQRLNVSGYGASWTDEFTVHPALKSQLNGVVTIEVPAILRVYVTP